MTYYEDNKEKIKQRVKAYQEANKEKVASENAEFCKIKDKLDSNQRRCCIMISAGNTSHGSNLFK